MEFTSITSSIPAASAIPTVPTVTESQEQLQAAIKQAEQEAAETLERAPIGGKFAFTTRMNSNEVSKLQQRDGARTCVVFIGKLLYYRERLWKFEGSFTPPSWFVLATAEEVQGSKKFTDDQKELYCTAYKQCLEAGARRLAAKQYS